LSDDSASELRKLRRQHLQVRFALLLSFIAAMATTALVLFSSPSFPGYNSQVAGPATVQTTFTAITSTIASTTSFSSTVIGPPEPLSLRTVTYQQQYYGYAALVSWAAFAGAIIWRGHVRSVWGRSRFSYDTFRLLVKMRGGQTRLRLMHSLDTPKNKLQLATAMGLDWKAVDKHVQVLERNGLIQATTTSGTATFYEITDKGKRLLQLLEELGADIIQTGEQ